MTWVLNLGFMACETRHSRRDSTDKFYHLENRGIFFKLDNRLRKKIPGLQTNKTEVQVRITEISQVDDFNIDYYPPRFQTSEFLIWKSKSFVHGLCGVEVVWDVLGTLEPLRTACFESLRSFVPIRSFVPVLASRKRRLRSGRVRRVVLKIWKKKIFYAIQTASMNNAETNVLDSV